MVVEVAKEQFHIEKEKQTLDPMENAAEECKTYPENLPPNYTVSFYQFISRDICTFTI